MNLERLVSTFTGGERFPSELVLCNLADTKRRNSHLGSTVVDQDIATFDALVRKLTANGERSLVTRFIPEQVPGETEATSGIRSLPATPPTTTVCAVPRRSPRAP